MNVSLTWSRNATTGEYKTVCGRFYVIRDTSTYSRHGAWVVYDRVTPDLLTGHGSTTRRKFTLASAKDQCRRWANGKQ